MLNRGDDEEAAAADAGLLEAEDRVGDVPDGDDDDDDDEEEEREREEAEEHVDEEDDDWTCWLDGMASLNAVLLSAAAEDEC